MKKINIVLIILIVLFVNVDAFATRDDSNLQNIKNWKYYTSDNDTTYSYEHKENNEPKVYTFDNDIGSVYYYVKVVPPQKVRDEMQKKLEIEYPKEFKKLKLGYSITWNRMNCENEMVEVRQLYLYSDTNEFIISFDMKNDKGLYEAKPYSGKIPFNKELIKQEKEKAEFKDKKEASENELKIKLKQYNAEALVPISMLEANPYEFEGRIIAVVVQFRKMLSKDSASFYSGYADMEEHTNVYDEIIVTEIPKGTHFESGPFSPRMMLVLKGKGTIAGTNAFGARINAPHFQWIAIMSGKQKSVFEEQRDVSRKNALQNMKNAYPKRD